MKTYKFSKASLEAMIRMIFQDTLGAVAQIDYDALGNNQDKIVAEIEVAMEKQVKHVIDMVDEMDRNIASGPQAIIDHLKATLKERGIDLDADVEAKINEVHGNKPESAGDNITPQGSC